MGRPVSRMNREPEDLPGNDRGDGEVRSSNERAFFLTAVLYWKSFSRTEGGG